MKKLLCAITLLLAPSVVFGKTYPPGWEYSEPSADDEFMTNRFGRTWSDPVYNGYLVVDDHYVDAPYVVEQRGFVIFVNGERVEDGIDIRMVSPLKREPVTEDPGPPPSEFVKTSHVYQVLGHPYHEKYKCYWDHLGLRDQALVDTNIWFFRSLPCISNVVDTGGSGLFPGSRCINISDFNGLTLKYHMGLVPRTTPVHEDSGLYTYLPRQQRLITESFQNNRYRRVIDQNLRLDGPGPENDELPRWYAAFRTMESAGLTATQRFERLKTLQMIYTNDRMAYCEVSFPIRGFHTSSQLWQRLSGDVSWTNDAPARLLALTNGWQRILPAFMRTQTVAVTTVATVPKLEPEATTAPVSTHTVQVHRTPQTPALSPTDVVVPREEHSKWQIPVVVALAGILVCLLFLTRHLFRKWNRDDPQ